MKLTVVWPFSHLFINTWKSEIATLCSLRSFRTGHSSGSSVSEPITWRPFVNLSICWRGGNKLLSDFCFGYVNENLCCRLPAAPSPVCHRAVHWHTVAKKFISKIKSLTRYRSEIHLERKEKLPRWTAQTCYSTRGAGKTNLVNAAHALLSIHQAAQPSRTMTANL